MQIRLLCAHLHYHPALVLHTASSGAINHLAELYLVLEDEGLVLGLGEVRENISYLNGLNISDVRAAVIGLLEEIDWESDPQEIIQYLSTQIDRYPAVARALVDCTVHDWWARQNKVSVIENLGYHFSNSHVTNQCIFWCSDMHCIEMAQGYVERNFNELKLRVGIGEFSQDLKRIALLRKKLGPSVKLSVDVNGMWEVQDALENIEQLASLNISYVEQPIAPGNWAQLEKLAENAPVPIMLDESISTINDVKRTINTHDNLAVHLKIVKIGGITPLLEAAEILNQNNRIFMIGQMNEGGGATASAFQCAVIARPTYAELYGADGLQDDMLDGVDYVDGKILITEKLGVGVQFSKKPETSLWEKKI